MHPLEVSTQTGPILVTLAYLLVYYGLAVNAARTKIRLTREYAKRGEKFDRYFGQDREMLAADRFQLNQLEHMPPFLILLWLVAVFVSPVFATVGGSIYVLTRVLYPFMMGSRLGRGVKGSILVATLPSYLVLLSFMGALVWAIVA
ncbi:MAG: MAPEG family protein [Moraxellaceae bacterium]|nr:MAPEG family protein [Moraxellaceae bacterium]MDZ4297211.1 MAPEG family protein [Moraxellaceae bacterium]MDZ4386191.1 MAPEG family protein [Moraxellaceae bacterium]